MAFKTSVKAVLLSLEPEPQAEPPHFFPREREPLAERPRLPEPSAPPLRPADAEPEAGNWSGRAEKIRAMVPLLPSEATRPLMLKIAELYAELATDAAGAAPAPEAPPPDALPHDDLPPEDLPGEEPSAFAPPRDLGVAARAAFPRRPLSSGRAGSTRR